MQKVQGQILFLSKVLPEHKKGPAADEESDRFYLEALCCRLLVQKQTYRMYSLMPADTDGFMTARNELLQLGDPPKASEQQLVCGLTGPHRSSTTH